MALQDLTPQLRTRLSRMERAVGWFVLLAAALLVFGFGYYVRTMARNKGWFKQRAAFFTFVDSAAGLKVGDPVVLRGEDAGQITEIKQMPPESDYNVYVAFELKEPNFGYIWTGGSRAKINTANFLGQRAIEVTRGTNGHAVYQFNPLVTLLRSAVEKNPAPGHWLLAADLYDKENNLLVPALSPLDAKSLAVIARLGLEKIPALDATETRKNPTVVWHDQDGAYVQFISKSAETPQRKSNLYWLVADETPAVTERAEKILKQVEGVLPFVTNKIAGVAADISQLASNLNTVAVSFQPAATNLAELSAQLRGPGAFGQWMLGTNGFQQLNGTMEKANATMALADTNLLALVENVTRSLDNLADFTSNLNAQAQSNPNILSNLSQTVVDADTFVQGLKRHWLLRSAFKPGKTNEAPRAISPRDSGSR